MSNDVPAVSAAVRILHRLAADWPRPVMAGPLIKELEINRSTAYSILATLQKVGWAVNLGGRNGWTLGPKLLVLTRITGDRHAAAFQQEIEEMSRELGAGFVTFVAESDGAGGYVTVAKAELQTGIRVTVSIGETFPFSAPALMQAFCAWLPPEEFEGRVQRHGLERFNERTVTDPAALRAVLAQVRADGFARSLQQYNLSQSAVAAPVFDEHGRAFRAICTLGFASDLHEGNVEDIGRIARTHAERITARVGGVPAPTYRAA
jgi:DNA-binding IclR family transcriptional regulator